MDPIDLFLHLLNFLAPALGLAALLAIFARFFVRKRTSAFALWAQIAITFVACALALGLGLWFFGRDGKMASYAAMLLCGASSQWLMQQGWKA
ncbi:MAG: hypothetical protein IPO43_20290 [Rhodoferax sp.]|nr:hypothetical protein [Rhodoferax sp.]